jgi:hypothetical protein
MTTRPAKKRRKRPMSPKDLSRVLVDRMTDGALTKEKREPTLNELAQMADVVGALAELIARDRGVTLGKALASEGDEVAEKKRSPRKSKRASRSRNRE